MASDHEPPAREFNKVMLYWRELIGEETFHTYRTADLWNWYEALERMGALDVRARLTERSSAWVLKELNGIVPHAPHPPVVLVEKWLATHEGKRSIFIPIGVVAWLFLAISVGASQLSGCTLVAPPNQLQSNPPLKQAGMDFTAPRELKVELFDPTTASAMKVTPGVAPPGMDQTMKFPGGSSSSQASGNSRPYRNIPGMKAQPLSGSSPGP